MMSRARLAPADATSSASPQSFGLAPGVRSLPALLFVSVALAWVLVLTFGPAQSRAQTNEVGVPQEAVSAIARELNCPICQGYNLQDCPLEVCAQMRELIREQLAAGQTPDEIKASFVEEYGPQVLNAPPTEGVFLGAWVLPVIVLLAGAVVVGVVVWRGARRREHDASDEGSSADATERAPETAYAERLEQMLDGDDG